MGHGIELSGGVQRAISHTGEWITQTTWGLLTCSHEDFRVLRLSWSTRKKWHKKACPGSGRARTSKELCKEFASLLQC